MSSFFILKDEQRRENCLKYLKDVSIVKPLTVKISSKNEKSGNQERYWHMLVGILADYIGERSEVTKMRLKYEWLPLVTVTNLVGKEYIIPVSTTILTKEEYSELIEKTLALGTSLNLYLPPASHFGLEDR